MIVKNQDINNNGEQLIRNYLEKKIKDNLIPLNQLPQEILEKLNFDYLDLRKYLQSLYLKGGEFEIEGFESFIFHLIQKRRESLENLFYMGKIFARIKSPLVLWFILYSNYNNWEQEETIKPLYPLKSDFGIGISYEKSFYFSNYELRRYDYPIYFEEINNFLNLFFENVQKMVLNIDLQDCLDYQSKTILFNNISPERYEKTLITGCKVLSRGFDTLYWHISITRNVPLILDTIKFATEQIEFYENLSEEKKKVKEKDVNINISICIPQEIIDTINNLPKDEKERKLFIDRIPELFAKQNQNIVEVKSEEENIDEFYFKQQYVGIKCLIETVGSIQGHFDEFEVIFQSLDKYPQLTNCISKARKNQVKLIKNPDFKYQTRAESSLNYFYDCGFSDFERIENLRIKDLCENWDSSTPNDEIQKLINSSFSYRKAILQKCLHPELIELKSAREISDQVRDELGVPRIGEGWKNETFLFKLIYELLEPKGIKSLHHYKPEFLSRQELDIYFEYENKKVGIEYQGLQHFEPVDYFGGEETFIATVERDQRKKRICEENEIILIYVNHWEVITQEFVIRKLKEYGIEINRNVQ